MVKSDIPGFQLRSTSLDARIRFAPAMLCSTRTRIRASLRLTRFSASVNARPRGFFFRLASLRHRWLVALEPRGLVQHGPRREFQASLVGDPLVIDLARVGRAEEYDPLARPADHQDVLVGVRLLLAAVVQRLFFGLFGPLTPALGAVDDQQRRAERLIDLAGDARAVALGQDAQLV